MALKIVSMAAIEEALAEPTEYELADAVSELYPVDQAGFYNNLGLNMDNQSLTQLDRLEFMMAVFSDETGGLNVYGELFFDTVTEAWEKYKRDNDSRPTI